MVTISHTADTTHKKLKFHSIISNFLWVFCCIADIHLLTQPAYSSCSMLESAECFYSYQALLCKSCFMTWCYDRQLGGSGAFLLARCLTRTNPSFTQQLVKQINHVLQTLACCRMISRDATEYSKKVGNCRVKFYFPIYTIHNSRLRHSQLDFVTSWLFVVVQEIIDIGSSRLEEGLKLCWAMRKLYLVLAAN